MTVAALYRVRIRHQRATPVRHGFRHGHVMWLLDVDGPPRLPRLLRPLARFDARDHFDGRPGSLRAALDRYLAGRGVDLAGGRALLLRNARSWGHAFDPLSVWWCFAATGDLACVVAEVHNTYGERHAYLLPPAAVDGTEVEKAFYVSPFFDVAGRYHLRLPVPGEEIALSVTLRQGGRTVFGASLTGRRRAATVPAVLAAALRYPLGSWRVSALIRLHGGWLWLRRLPVVPRPPHAVPKGMP